MVKLYTCPTCNTKQRIIVDPRTNETIPNTRCVSHSCKSYTVTEPCTSETYINNIVHKYRRLVGKYYALGVDGTDVTDEVVIDVQPDGSVILVDRVDYLPVRLTAKQFEVYEEAAKNAQNAQGAESSNNDQAEDVTNAEFVDKN